MTTPVRTVVSTPRKDYLRPTAYKRTTVDRARPLAATSPLLSGRLTLVAFDGFAGDLVSSLSFWSFTTAAGTPLNQWFALFDANRVKLAISADDTTTAWAAGVEKTLNMTTPYTLPADGLYYAGVCVVATTVPQLLGVNIGTNILMAKPPIQVGTADTGLTTPATCPATAAALTAIAAVPYAGVG